MSKRSKDEVDRDRAMHAASKAAREDRDEADRVKSREDAHKPKHMHTEKPGTVRSDGMVVMPVEEDS